VKNVALAIFISVAFHAALAAIVAAALSTCGGRDVADARLDLSKLDFSFSSEEDETLAETVAALPQTPAQKEPPKPPVPEPVEPPPAPNGVAQPDDPKLPTPEENRNAAEMTPPPAPPTPPVAPAPKQARIDAPPHPKSSIKPEYPAASRERGEQGKVLLEIAVTAEGAVSEAKVVSSSGFAALDDAAVKAVRRAKFVPAKSEGRAVPGRVRLTLAFRLKNH